VIDAMQRLANSTTIENEETVPATAQAALREVRNGLVDLNKNCQIDWHRYFWEDYPLALLVGYYFAGKPYLYEFNIDTTLPTRCKAPFKAIGRGEYLGEFLLREYHQFDSDFQNGDLIAAATIEKVIPNVPGCGHPTWVGIVMPMENSTWQCDVFIYPKQLVQTLAQYLKEWELRLMPERKKHLEQLISEYWNRCGITIFGKISADNPILRANPKSE